MKNKKMKNYTEPLEAVLNLTKELAIRGVEMEFCYYPDPWPSFHVEFHMPVDKIPQSVDEDYDSEEDEDYESDWDGYYYGDKIRAHSGANGNLKLTAFELHKGEDWRDENPIKDFFAQFKGEFNPCFDGNGIEMGIEVPPSELLRVVMACL